MANLEYVPPPGSIDEAGEADWNKGPQPTWFSTGRWKRHHGSGIHAVLGWSELSVKLALLGLNPPVAKLLAKAKRMRIE